MQQGQNTVIRGACLLALVACVAACERAPGSASPAEPRVVPGKAAGQPAQAGVNIEAVRVSGTVYMLTGRGGNIGVSIGGDGVLMVDDQFAALAPKIRAAIAKIGGAAIDFLINTHHHGDHTGGNASFGAEARIVAHENVRKRLVAKGPTSALPVVTYRDALTLHFNGDEVRVWHMAAGHTDGDSLVLFKKANVLHAGDHFFNGRFPYVDLLAGGDPQALLRNIDTLLGMLPADVKIIPGHGPLATRDDLQAFAGMLRQTIGHVKAQVAAGKSLAQVKGGGLPAKWASWGTGFVNTDRWIATLYASLKR